MSVTSRNTVVYGRFLLFIAGMGGLLYGIDVGIITAALLYLDKTISLSIEQTSILVAAVLGGGMASSLVAGVLADWFGRKTMMVVSGLMFVSSVGLIVASQDFYSLLIGRLLQGMSGGVIAVVVPLYLAECLSSKRRGQGTAIFQFMLTFGIVIAAVTGYFYTQQAEAAITAAAGNAVLIKAAQNHAWRGMFLSVIYPGLIFFIGSFFLSESPRWLLRKGKPERAMAALRRAVSEEEAETEMREMETLASPAAKTAASGSLLRRKYVLPFLLACVILSLNQTTGINSVLGYLVIILKQAGMNATHATQGDLIVKILNCVMTLVGVALVDRKGRKFLLRLGTGGIVLACLAGGLIFLKVESHRQDVLYLIQQHQVGNSINVAVNQQTLGNNANGRTMALTVLYTTGQGDKVSTVLNTDSDPVLKIAGEPPSPAPSFGPKWVRNILHVFFPDRGTAPVLILKKAQYGPVPEETTGWLVTACLALFIASYACGPGVVVWLMLSELMPTRIRALGMGIALLLNQGISTGIAGVFLPVVGNYGYYAMFFFWSGCTVLYFLTAAFFVPETKGKSLEEIEVYFEKGTAR
jgi:MFS transporter, SP family, solute carrier family 2 (myo-inositol transporter), member 13